MEPSGSATSIKKGSLLFLHGLAGIGIATTQQAALALHPLVGIYATQLFAIGLLGASLLAAAVLPLSTAFSICEAFGAERSVDKRFRDAPLFFILFWGMLTVGALIMLVPSISVTGIAIGTQTLDGILLPILLIFILILVNDKLILRNYVNGITYNLLALLTIFILSMLTFLLLLTTLFPQIIL